VIVESPDTAIVHGMPGAARITDEAAEGCPKVGRYGFVFNGRAVGPAWQDLIARCFPVERRGRFFGTAMFAGTAAGAVAALGSAWLLRSYAFPANFALSFAMAAVLVTVSWAFIALTREPVQPGRSVRQSTRQHLSGLPDLLRADPEFRRFLITRW
jgi:MFS family permease